jgi:hypothetical protein
MWRGFDRCTVIMLVLWYFIDEAEGYERVLEYVGTG